MTDTTRNLIIKLSSHMAYMQGQLEARHELDDLDDYYWYRESVALRQQVADALATDEPAVPEGREPASVTGEPSDEELLELMPKTMRDEFSYAAKVCADATGYQVKPGIFRVCLNTAALEYARAVLARYGHQLAPLAAEGEVAELVAWLRNMANADLGGIDELNADRAADLLSQRHPTPVPVAVSERLPGPGDCDENGDCWFDTGTDVGWMLCDKVFGLRHGSRWWLPFHALPLPQGEVE